MRLAAHGTCVVDEDTQQDAEVLPDLLEFLRGAVPQQEVAPAPTGIADGTHAQDKGS